MGLTSVFTRDRYVQGNLPETVVLLAHLCAIELPQGTELFAPGEAEPFVSTWNMTPGQVTGDIRRKLLSPGASAATTGLAQTLRAKLKRDNTKATVHTRAEFHESFLADTSPWLEFLRKGQITGDDISVKADLDAVSPFTFVASVPSQEGKAQLKKDGLSPADLGIYIRNQVWFFQTLTEESIHKQALPHGVSLFSDHTMLGRALGRVQRHVETSVFAQAWLAMLPPVRLRYTVVFLRLISELWGFFLLWATESDPESHLMIAGCPRVPGLQIPLISPSVGDETLISAALDEWGQRWTRWMEPSYLGSHIDHVFHRRVVPEFFLHSKSCCLYTSLSP